ncbi:hypothetical protein GFD24_02000 [Bifidobacterium ramosum]|uniref:Head fiber protein n=1 Tax=Bifidobacterium ramosum TaxID=1798158 RepID=A0A7K3T8Z0_9BIFI|nr:hypothetical protein [Bifidobacterium ramosum]
MNAQVQFVHQDKPEPGQLIEQVAAFDADGNPVDIGGAPAAGSVTNAMLAGGITADKLAKGVIPAVPTAPTADTLTGVTVTGRAVMKATDAAAARTAIGAGTPYTLPAAGTALGGVKKGAAVANLAADATAPAIVTTVNALLAQLRTSGVIAA